MAMKAKHAFGNLADVEKALQTGKINEFDILFLDGDTSPKIGWIDANGNFRLVEHENDFAELEAVIATKANAEEVEAKLAEKAEASDVEVLKTQIATKVDAAEIDAKIEEKIAEVETAYEVIEF